MNNSRLQQKSIFTPLKHVTKAGVTACLVMSVNICPPVFVHLLIISHLRRRLRTYQNISENTTPYFQNNIVPAFRTLLKYFT